MTDAASYPSLAGRVALVTGGASGIGAVIAAGLARQGARLAILDIDEAAGGVTAEALGALFLPCDLAEVDALRRAVAEAEARLGPVRALVNNAANDRRHDPALVTPEEWDASQAVNLRSQFFTAQAVHPGMARAGGGAIVNLSSVAYMGGAPDMVPYAAAKAGCAALAVSLGRAWGAERIRVNAVAPGAVMTERQMRLWHTPESRTEIVARQAIPTDLVEADIAAAVLFLLSDDAAMITKQCLVVDGGLR